MKETGIKNEVKNIFATNVFEVALELTRTLRKEYIDEYGIKSWNGLVTYWRGQNVQPEEAAAHEVEYLLESDVDEVASEDSIEESQNGASETPDESSADDEAEITSSENPLQEDEMVEYMLYRNSEGEVQWFGHSENFRLYPVGHNGRFIRMNNRGVGEGFVVATASLSLDQVAIFHRCYAVIIKTKYSWKEQLEMASKVLVNLNEALSAGTNIPNSDIKLVDYILNYGK